MKKSIIILNNLLSLVIINMIAMTKSRYVPYGFALTLKELGFKERVLTYYENEVPKLHNDINGWDFNTSFITCVSRPTFQEAFDWFWENHELHSHVRPFFDFEGNMQYQFEILIKKDGRYNNDCISDILETIEKAEIACLEHLILIRIVALKNK